MRRSWIIVTLLVAFGGLLGVGKPISAQEATPALEPIIVPAANQCTVTPRDAASLAQFAASPVAAAATPAAMGEGEPADREVRSGVLDTIRQSLACTNAGNFLALYSLFTDDYLVANAPSAEMLAAMEADPVPLVGDLAALLAIVDIRAFADGRVVVVVDTFDPIASPPGPVRSIVTLVEQDGRYLIDNYINEPIDGSQVGTPAA